MSFEEQIVSKDKYPRTAIPSNLFRNAHSFENWGTFSDMARLDRSRERKYLMNYNQVYKKMQISPVMRSYTQPNFDQI